MHSRRNFLRAVGAISALGAPIGTRMAFAQSTQFPMRILCGTPAGSIPDIIARRYAEQLSTRHAGGALVDNRPGAAGQIAVTALKQAVADGNTILLAPSAMVTVYPYLYGKLPYDPDADLKPVSIAAEATLALAVGPAVPEAVRSLTDLVEWLRANPRLANYGSPGQGTLPHMLSAMLFREAKVAVQHVGYAGGPPAIVDLVGGNIAMLALPEGLLRPHHEARKLRVLATSGSTRSSFMPQVPTFAEEGYRDLVVREWFAFFMPGTTSASLVASVSRALRLATESPPLMASFRELGMNAAGSTPENVAERIAAERPFWKNIVSATGIRVET